MSEATVFAQLAKQINGRTPPVSREAPRAPRLEPRRADISRSKPFRWAWDEWLLLGYLNLLVGDEGVGKGTFLAWLVARLTTGMLPGSLGGEPARVLMVGDEDGFDGVVVPRLHAAGANLELIDDLPVDPDHGALDLRRDAPELRRLIAEGDYRIVVIDQLLDNLGAAVDDWRAKPVREAVAPLRRIAQELDVAFVASLHTNKSKTGGFRQRVSGTQAFNALSRSSLLLAEHPENPEVRVVVRGKGNYAPSPRAVEFEITTDRLMLNGHDFTVGVATGVKASDVTLGDILGASGPKSKADSGRDLITAELTDGQWHPVGAMLTALANEGIGEREARRLANDLGVEKRRTEGFPSSMEWRLSRGGLPDSHTSRTSRTGENHSPATPATPVERQARTTDSRCGCERPLAAPSLATGDLECARCGLRTDGWAVTS